MKENFPHPNNPFELKIEAIISKQLQKIETERAEIDPLQYNKYLQQIEEFKNALPEMIDDEGKEYLVSVSDEELESLLLPALARDERFRGGENKDIPLTKAQLQNILTYKKVYGYGHPDLEERIEKDPMPTAAELLLGCYAEQIEEQTRNAVFIMRMKGYDTVQSGFYDKMKGSQFFDIYESEQTAVPQALHEEMDHLFGVQIVIDRHKETGRTMIELVPSKFKDISEWQEALDYFADHMSAKGKQELGGYGMGVDFIYDAITTYKKEDILATSENEQQKELVEKLYKCKTKEEIILLLNKEPDNAERMVIEDKIEQVIEKDLSSNISASLREIKSEFTIAAMVIDKEDIEEGLEVIKNEKNVLEEKYSKDLSSSSVLESIDRAISYLENRIEKAH